MLKRSSALSRPLARSLRRFWRAGPVTTECRQACVAFETFPAPIHHSTVIKAAQAKPRRAAARRPKQKQTGKASPPESSLASPAAAYGLTGLQKATLEKL